MFLQRLSKLLVVCWMESHSVSLAHASESCSRTSQILNTDSTPAVCCSMSCCRSCHCKRIAWVEGNVQLAFRHPLSKCCRGWGKSNLCVRTAYLALENRLAGWAVQMTGWQVRTELPCEKGIIQLWFLSESSIFSLTVWTILMCIQNPNLTHTINIYLLILTTVSDISLLHCKTWQGTSSTVHVLQWLYDRGLVSWNTTHK